MSRKFWYINPTGRERIMVRSNSCHAQVASEPAIVALGFVRVGFIKYWLHVVLWRSWKRKAEAGES